MNMMDGPPKIHGCVGYFTPKWASKLSGHSVRKMPAPKPRVVAPEPARPAAQATVTVRPAGPAAPSLVLTPPKRAGVIEPTSAQRFKVSFAAPQTLVDKLEQARTLVSHRKPGADLAELVELGLELLIEAELKRKIGAGQKARKSKVGKATRVAEVKAPPSDEVPPAPSTRYIPVEVRREVWERDGGTCTFTDAETGRRCGSAWQVEFDHVYAWGLGGETTAETWP